ncbi:Phycobiliprotein ApcE [Ceratobasidium sp. AG-Ba]|nr:Phycobiliprotein ApcE [Ceratobasidium sp. AG-Ba]
MSICLDNASNNNTFVQSIAPKLPRFLGAGARGRCLAHIGNLSAQPSSKKRRRTAAAAETTGRAQSATSSGTPSLPTPPSAADILGASGDPNEPEVVLDNLDGILELPDDSDEGKQLFDKGEVRKAVAAAFERMKTQYGVTVSPDELREACDLFPKVNGFASSVLNSDLLRVAFTNIRNICKAQGEITTDKELPSSFVSTRWNSQLKTGKTHLDLRPAVEVMTANSNNNLEKCHLSKLQWELLGEVCECLEIFEEITLLFSQKDTATIHEALPALYLTRYRLTRMCDNVGSALHSITRVAASSAIYVVDKYAKLLEETHLYPLAVVLCPWYKLQWFEDNGFDNRRIRSVVQKLHDYYQWYYAQRSTAPETTSPSVRLNVVPQPRNQWMVGPAVQRLAPQPRPSNRAFSAIDIYLTSDLISQEEIESCGGLLAHWMREQTRGSPLAEMALDILTSPASSVDAERAFSGGRMAVNYKQHRMSLSTFRAKMAVGSWYGTPLLTNIGEVIDIMNDGSQDEPELLDI